MMADHFIGTWSEHGTSVRMDVFCFAVAVLIHAPLLWVRLDMRKKAADLTTNRLVAVDLIEAKDLKPEVKAPPAPPPAKKGDNLMEKLKAMVKKSPPPPPPKPKEIKTPDKLAMQPKEIKIEPKLKIEDRIAPTLKGKDGFKAANPELVKQKQISLKDMGAGLAPLSAQKFGTIENRAKIKDDRGNFQVAKNESLSSIGGKGPALVGTEVPTIAIKTGRASSESFSAPPPQKENKGSFQGSGVSTLGSSGPKLGLRDSVIARHSAPIAVPDASGSAGGVPGGMPGGLGTKRDAGSFQGSSAGVLGGSGSSPGYIGGVKGGTGTGPSIASKPKAKKEMFTITGPLKDRPIVYKVIPEYPAWAQQQGIEASVILEFTVTPEGSVKNLILVRRTSGYPKLDESAMEALRKWLFSPLTDGSNRHEVGQIVFNYTLT